MRPPAWLAAVRIVPLGAAIAACGGPLGPAATAAPTTDAPSTATDGAPPPATGGPTDPSELPLPAFAIADPAGLPAWPTDRAGDRLAIAAVEVDLAMLIGAVQLRGHHVVLRSDQALRVSGRLAAGSRPDAIAALTALSARVGVRIAPAPPARRHRGRPLELAVAGSDPEDLVRPLSDVLGVDVVLPPGPFTPLDVAARDAPVDGVLDAVASALGLRAHRDRALIFLAPAAAPPPPRVAARGPRVFLDVADASLGETVDLLRALLPVAGGFACDAGARIHLRLRRVPLDQALVAIGHRRSVPVDPAAVAGCGTKEGDARALLAGGARLIGVALHGSAGAALLRRPDGSAAIVRAKPGGPLRIAEDRVALAAPNADGARPPPAELLLRTPPGERHDFLAFPGRWRVSATILEAGAPAIARLESIAGDARWIVAWSPRADQPSPTPGLGEVVIEASRVRITGAYGDAVELKLGRWDR